MAEQNTAPSQGSLQDTIAKEGAAGWQKLYEASVKPWDQGCTAPALEKVIAEEELPDGLAIVPGCGLGYDIKALATEKRRVVGVEIAPLAVEQALPVIKNTPNAEILLHDFFTVEFDGQVDLLYDYTFLCALPPSMRKDWAAKLAKLLKIGGVVITLMFPLSEDPSLFPNGPPFLLSLDIYKELLEPHGFELYKLDRNPPSFPKRQGHEHIGLWRRISETGPVNSVA